MASPPRQKQSSLPASSAWTRLVQVTKRASQTSQLHDNTKPPPLPLMRKPENMVPRAIVDDSGARLAPKRRRITGPATVSALARLRASRQAARAFEEIAEEDRSAVTPETTLSSKDRHTEKHTEVCPPPKDEADERCNFASPGNVENSSARASASPGCGDMRAPWDPRRVAEQDRQIRQDQFAVEGHTPASETAQEDEVADQSAEDENTINLLRKGESRDSVSEVGELPGQGQATDDTPQQDMVGAADDPTTSDGVISTLRDGFKMRRNTKVKKELDTREEVHEKVCQQVNAKNNADAPVNINTAKLTRVPSSSTSPAFKPGLREGSKYTLNRTPNSGVLKQKQPEVTQLATPASSQSSNSNDENLLSRTATRKAKRRLTLHDTQPPPKRRKPTLPKKKTAVQTTLALAVGDSAGMRECKVCDTVWNPFHPEDVKVHKKRHAGVVKERAELALDVDA